LKYRLDRLVVERGMASSREKAQALIMSGQVLVDGQKATKAGASIDTAAELKLVGEPAPFVSRGGVKLDAALEAFAIDLTGLICLDIGASTGGFTDCMLQRGAAKVYAVDVGAGQIDWRLRQHSRVVLREKLNARYLEPSDIGELVDFAAMDVSFISATMILPRLAAVIKPSGGLVVLVKPQFEVGRRQVGKGGIVRDPALHAAAVEKVTAAALTGGFTNPRSIPSPIKGADGNQEFLLYYLHAGLVHK
jgi:23S rRNA (cytidine1920-2'-O)/16S rRNA (cytidine1409-2'-O)-methyltransferase